VNAMGRLSGRTALVTGAARGIGAAIARRLAAEGAAVLVADVFDRDGERIVDELRQHGARGAFVHLDVTSEQEWEAAVVAAAREFDGLDILVNCVSAAEGGPIEELTLAHWNRVVAASQTGVFLSMKTAVDLLAASDHGSVINVSPVVAGATAVVSPAAHAGSGAIRALTRNVAAHWAPLGVRVNAVFAGFIDCTSPGAGSEANSQIPPLGRRGSPADVAAGVAYLASDDSGFVTGLDLRIDGGFQAAGNNQDGL
jgi:NAD(P)-dependent dehydrogenase (short-subunit alcohol dehydrogenase family)